MSQPQQVINPNQWVYAKWYKGQEVSPRQLNRIVSDWTRHTQVNIIESVCKATNSIAVCASLLSRRQRDKYKDQRAMIGRQSIYFFVRDHIPLDVLESIDWNTDQVIHEKIG